MGSKLDYEEAVKHSFSIVVTDELGGKGEQTFDFSIIDAFSPIVRTEQYRLSVMVPTCFPEELWTKEQLPDLSNGVLLRLNTQILNYR